MSGAYSSRAGAKCPHCKHLHEPKDDPTQLFDETAGRFACHQCGRAFALTVSVEYSWTTSPLEQRIETRRQDGTPWDKHAEGND